jgi:hypothetical protein
MSRPTAIVYVDGFNLYRQKLTHHPNTKWLDLVKLSELLLPTHDIIAVRYFTANIRPMLGTDPQGPIRQQTYIRALETDPKVSVYRGTFRVDKRMMVSMPVTIGANGKPDVVKVRKTEEKGSDVNLASYMIFDACKAAADVHVLVSNDSDYATALSILTNEVNASWGLFSPVDSPNTVLLREKPLFVKTIRAGVLLAAQFPDQMNSESEGRITRPATWALTKQGPLAGPRTR